MPYRPNFDISSAAASLSLPQQSANAEEGVDLVFTYYLPSQNRTDGYFKKEK